jgi:hypothetical protein
VTQSASGSVASSWINRCATSKCAGGDLDRDITSMRSIYANYCNGAGFKQPIVSNWLTGGEGETTTTESPESSKTSEASRTEEPEESVPPETSRTVTLVTQTADPENPDSQATRSKILLEETSIIWVNPEGSQIPASAEKSKDDAANKLKMGLGIGLGVGLAVVFAVIGIIVFLCLRKKKRAAAQPPAPPYVPADEYPVAHPELPPQSVSPMSGTGIERKPIATTPSPLQSEKTELSAQHATREISGRPIQPPSPITPHPAQSEGGHRYEMWVETHQADVPPQMPPAQARNVAELGRSDPRYELGGR